MIGIREVDREERELVKRSGVRVFTMKEIDKRGIGAVMDEALALSRRGQTAFPSRSTRIFSTLMIRRESPLRCAAAQTIGKRTWPWRWSPTQETGVV